MAACQSVTDVASKLLLKFIPKPSDLFIDLGCRFFIFRACPSELHPDDHHRTDQGPAHGPFSGNASAKPRRQLGKERIFATAVLLETQGDGFGSIKSVLKVTPCLFGYHFRIPCCHRISFPFPVRKERSVPAVPDFLCGTSLERAAYSRIISRNNPLKAQEK